MTEQEFLATLIEVARAASWIPFHVIDIGNNRRDYALARQALESGNEELALAISRSRHARVTAVGFPDLGLRHAEHGVIFAELKSDDPASKPTLEQWEWLIALRASLTLPFNTYAPSRAHLWRPRHWPAIETQLGLYTTPARCECPVCLNEMPPLQKRPTGRRNRRW